MSTRDDIETIYTQAQEGLQDMQVLAALGGGDEGAAQFNLALYEARHKAVKASLLLLADKIDGLR